MISNRLGRTVCALGVAALAALATARAQVVINELMTSNGETLLDENGDAPDWFELFNASEQPTDLEGWGLSDARNTPFKWIVRGLVVPPRGFVTLFASGKDRQPQSLPAVHPATLPGLRLWLRADAVNPNDATQVRRSGSSVFVQRWANSVVGGVDAKAPDPTTQPLWLAAHEGVPASLRFDGSNDLLRLPAPPATNNFCLVAVFRTSQQHEIENENAASVGGTAGQRYLFGADHGGDFAAGAGLSVGTNGVSVYEHGSGYMPPLAVFQGVLGSGTAIVTVNYLERRPALGVQGIIVSEGLPSARAEVTAPVEIGAGAYGAFGGDLIEVLLFDRALTEIEVRGVERHLAARHAVALLQPRHTNFQLSAEGERLTLTRPDGTTADRIAFGAVPRDVSYGRQPDGAADWFYFAEPTPGAANSPPGSSEFLSPPEFSRPAGFHTGAFDLSLNTPAVGAEIRYTLDGSEPTVASPRYDGPLRILARAGTPNGISTIPTVPGGAPPQGEVFKGWTVRARVLKPGALPSAVATRSYWVDARGRGRYTLPVVSLATAAENFFDPRLGIYVPGDAPNGNYSQRGPEWERPVHVELFEPDGVLAFAQEAGVKIHGNTSQGFPIKGLDLDGTSGRGRQPFRHRIFPDRARAEFEHFLLRPTGHDQLYAFMRDELMQSLAAETGAESQAARPCVVFLNGEYWGLHYLKEKEDAEFVGYYGDHPADELDYLEGYAAAKTGDTRHWDAMMSGLAATDLTSPTAYAELQTRMEVANYTDYKVCEIFFYRWDIGNHRLWRPRTPEGRWRWLQFDNDVGWGGFWAEQPAWQFDMLTAVLTPDGGLHGHAGEATTFLLRRLMTNPQFQEAFVNRFCDLLNSVFLPTHTRERIDSMATVLAPEMAEHIRRWRSPGSFSQWQANVEYLRTYANQRPGFARQHLARRFELGATATLSAAVNDPARGSVRVNTLSITAPTATPWSGVYFQRHPLQLTAVANPGYRLERWEGILGVTTPSVRLLLNDDTAITAVFEPDPEFTLRLLNPERAADGALLATIVGPAGSRCRVEFTGDLATWLEAGEWTLDEEGRARVRVSSSPAAGFRFLRARLQ